MNSVIGFAERERVSDEKVFHLDKRRNHQNYRFWSKEKSGDERINQLDAHPFALHCWDIVDGILGPFFFDQTVDQFEYQKIIDLHFWPALTNLVSDDVINTLWF